MLRAMSVVWTTMPLPHLPPASFCQAPTFHTEKAINAVQMLSVIDVQVTLRCRSASSNHLLELCSTRHRRSNSSETCSALCISQ